MLAKNENCQCNIYPFDIIPKQFPRDKPVDLQYPLHNSPLHSQIISPSSISIGFSLKKNTHFGDPPFMETSIQDGAPKIAKLVYKWLNNGLW